LTLVPPRRLLLVMRLLALLPRTCHKPRLTSSFAGAVGREPERSVLSYVSTPSAARHSQRTRSAGAVLAGTFPAVALAVTLLAIGLLSWGCGGSSEPADSPSDESAKSRDRAAQREATSTAADEAEAEEEETGRVPTECAKPGEFCTPSKKFMERLCADSHPSVALVMFSGGTPWTRAYVAVREIDPVNAFGGMAGGDPLVLDEEVIVLFARSSNLGGMQVSGTGSYQVLRWNGTCATLAEGELRTQRPGRPKYAKVTWRYLEAAMREALRKDQRIVDAYRARRKECKGATMGTVSDKCEKYDKQLTELIVEVVRSGSIDLPTPQKLP
jgi:hypothetical protein